MLAGYPAEEIGQEVLGHLWEARVDEALEALARHRTEMRNRPALDQIVEYIRNRGPYLPNYKMRREAGLGRGLENDGTFGLADDRSDGLFGARAGLGA